MISETPNIFNLAGQNDDNIFVVPDTKFVSVVDYGIVGGDLVLKIDFSALYGRVHYKIIKEKHLGLWGLGYLVSKFEKNRGFLNFSNVVNLTAGKMQIDDDCGENEVYDHNFRICVPKAKNINFDLDQIKAYQRALFKEYQYVIHKLFKNPFGNLFYDF